MRSPAKTTGLWLAAFWMLSTLAIAQDPPAPSSEGPETAAPADGSAAPAAVVPEGPKFNYQTGNIESPDERATLQLGES